MTGLPAATAPLPLLTRTGAERSPLLHFLRTELAPFPGRAIGTVRVVVAAVVTLILCMTLQIPEPHLTVWIVTRVAMEESSESLLTGLVFLVALTIGLAIPIARQQPDGAPLRSSPSAGATGARS